MSDSEAHNGSQEVSENIESKQQPEPTESDTIQPVEQKSEEDKSSLVQPEDANQQQQQQPQEASAGSEDIEKNVAAASCSGDKKDESEQADGEKDYLNSVAEEMVNEVFDEVVQTQITGTGEHKEAGHTRAEKADTKNNKETANKTDTSEEDQAKEVCVITSKSDWPVESTTAATIETPEVSSTRNDDIPSSKPARSSRRASYVSNRSYATGYQNYGLTYLPYKSNFEPSEEARRRADEFFKTYKL